MPRHDPLHRSEHPTDLKDSTERLAAPTLSRSHPARSYEAPVRLLVYGMLLLSAAVTSIFGDSLWTAWREGNVPFWAPLTPPIAFTAFVLAYAIDRWLLVQRRHYPVGRALFQVVFALVFLTLLLPPQAQELRASRQPAPHGPLQPAMLLLTHQDEQVRAAACDLLAGNFSPEIYEHVQNMVHHDPAATVRTDCAHALERLHAAASP